MYGVQWGCFTSQDSLESADPAYGNGETSPQTTIAITSDA
jgi:hypothetical protein